MCGPEYRLGTGGAKGRFLGRDPGLVGNRTSDPHHAVALAIGPDRLLASSRFDDDDSEAALEAAQAEVASAQAAMADAQAAVADAEAARQAHAATVTVSADGTQQSVKDAAGNTATAVTSDTGVVITMDAAPLMVALDNLADGDVQPVLASDGSELVASRTADADTVGLFHTDGSPAVNEDGEPYTTDDLTALVLIFALD